MVYVQRYFLLIVFACTPFGPESYQKSSACLMVQFHSEIMENPISNRKVPQDLHYIYALYVHCRSARIWLKAAVHNLSFTTKSQEAWMCGLSCKAEHQLLPLPRATMIKSSSGATNKQNPSSSSSEINSHRSCQSVLTNARTPLFAIMTSKHHYLIGFNASDISCPALLFSVIFAFAGAPKS